MPVIKGFIEFDNRLQPNTKRMQIESIRTERTKVFRYPKKRVNIHIPAKIYILKKGIIHWCLYKVVGKRIVKLRPEESAKFDKFNIIATQRSIMYGTYNLIYYFAGDKGSFCASSKDFCCSIVDCISVK